MNKKITVYTSITGGKDSPRDDIKVFSSYNRFKNPSLNAKIYKCLPHLFLDPETKYSIWVDGNLFLKVDPNIFVDMMDGDITVFKHPDRETIFEEAVVCKDNNLDEPRIIDEQISRYKQEGFSEKKLGACFLIVRKHTNEIARLNEQWWAEITRGSVRDQISFPYVYQDAQYLNLPDVRENSYFRREYHKKGKGLFQTMGNLFRKSL